MQKPSKSKPIYYRKQEFVMHPNQSSINNETLKVNELVKAPKICLAMKVNHVRLCLGVSKEIEERETVPKVAQILQQQIE